ncbi:DUF952 domain-containing protein [Congregibacter sp.]|jgi:uncharacterized protein (DUF952 family)|uniref:DUF952 domain-containing protein n=1 Tax=Congregibacter sp. TaxID=2744308 RepID=UPI0039E33AE4
MKFFLSLVVLIVSVSTATVSVADITLYHIVSQEELDTLTQDNIYSPLSIELEGYIHFSKLDLIMGYANGPYLDRKTLFLLQVTFADDDEYLRWIGDNPDYYRGLDLSMVERKGEFTRDKNSLWVLSDIFQ